MATPFRFGRPGLPVIVSCFPRRGHDGIFSKIYRKRNEVGQCVEQTFVVQQFPFHMYGVSPEFAEHWSGGRSTVVLKRSRILQAHHVYFALLKIEPNT
jgi:hypothetical protein